MSAMCWEKNTKASASVMMATNPGASSQGWWLPYMLDLSRFLFASLLRPFCCCLWLALQAPSAMAHGSVTAEGDLCIIRIGFYTAHFKVFQPGSSGDEEYCEDLPATGESVFVMDYLHQALGLVPIEFRIIRDVTGLGRFARLEDLVGIADLDAVTVFHQPPVIESAVFTVLHDFTEAGDYLGLVTVKHPETEVYYSALFPFSVGFRGWGMLPLFVVLALVAQLGWWLLTGGHARWRLRQQQNRQARVLMCAALLLVLPLQLFAQQGSVLSEQGRYRLDYSSAAVPLPLNRIHHWTLQLHTAAGEPVADAALVVTGGMPAHNHGLPTAPVVTALGNGEYRLEGLRFHMQGAWVLTVQISEGNARDTVLLPLAL